MADLIKTKNDKDYPELVRLVYHKLNDKYGTGARINRIFEMLRYIYDLQDFMVLDLNQVQGYQFESWLIDRQCDWMSGKPVNFREVYNAILTAGDFIGSEKKLFELGDIEERLWAIFLAVCDPNNETNI